MEESKNAFKILTGNPIVKRPLGRPRLRLVDNIRMDVKEIGINTRNCVDSDRDLLESPCECGIEPPGFISRRVT